MRYRSKRYGGKRTRTVRMSFQSFFDLSTQDGQMQIISVNAGGKDVLRRLLPFFGAYKYYKLGSVSFKLVPASTLPVDPSGLSYTENDSLVDPRDQLTPGMCRITNGEDILEDITGLTSEQQHELYNNMILDPRWYKWMLQSGVKRSAYPKYWQIGQLHQDKWPGAVTNLPLIRTFFSGDHRVEGTMHEQLYRMIHSDEVSNNVGLTRAGSSPYGLFQTGNKGRLGWLPTDGLRNLEIQSEGDFEFPNLASIPEIELFKILMPPARKTRYYYRAFITETVYFREPVVYNINGFSPLDVFRATKVEPRSPDVEYDVFGRSYDEETDEPAIDKITGGNDGSN